MHARSLAWAAALMALAVALGAFGAHGLKVVLGEGPLAQWQTGVLYHFLHALGILGLAALGDRLPPRAGTTVRTFFLFGILLFCGSLYLLSTRELLGIQGWLHVLGPLTPIGGLSFVAGWVTLLITALRMGAKR